MKEGEGNEKEKFFPKIWDRSGGGSGTRPRPLDFFPPGTLERAHGKFVLYRILQHKARQLMLLKRSFLNWIS